MEREGEGGLPKNVGCRATMREMSVDWQGGEGRGRSEACQKECWIDFSSSNQGLVSGIPQIKGCCQWVLISAMSMIGM